jgi:hypothetical protein
VTKRICGLRKERLDRVTTVHLFPHLRQIVAVDDAKIAEIMKKRGPLETYDADGKVMQ